MVSIKEIIKDKDFNSLDKEIQSNLNILLEKVNKIRTLWGKPMIITSGLRTKEDQIRIYKEKSDKAGLMFDESRVPMSSQHIHGAAVDIFDPDKELQKWCIDNEKELEQIGIWMESFSMTPNWVHIQVFPYGSWKQGKSIWFNP